VKFVDIEYGWKLDHEDLVGGGVVPLNLSVAGNEFEFHSTACLGIVLAQDNQLGVIGIAPKVKGAIVSALSASLSDALTIAFGFLGGGDILLLEQQSNGGPVEFDPHIARAIRVATLLGIVVIEPAGNGGHDLDLLIRPDGTTLDRGSPLFFDSGAIMVGARHALTRDRAVFPGVWASSFGSRVDCHAWGESIVTTCSNPGEKYMGVNPLGTHGFGGTSGASAIVAGAAASLQGIAKAQNKLLTPNKIRLLFSDPAFNTLSNNPAVDRIGVMPNLKEAASRL
jgi:hypothetical protein